MLPRAKLEGGSGELPKIALPFEEGAPDPIVRKRRTHVTLDRAIRFEKTPGCCGCEKVAEGVPHTDACHERFGTLLENEKLARAAKEHGISAPETPAPKTTSAAPKTPAGPMLIQEALDAKAFFQCCHAAPGKFDAKGPEPKDPQKLGDFWEYDDSKAAWKMVHLRPRKRLYAPVGKDCPFEAKDVTSERLTEWKCHGVTSVHRDNWQAHPHQRISSKSWAGCTWFFPSKPIGPKQGTMNACQANVSKANHHSQRFEKRSDFFIASMSRDYPKSSTELRSIAAGISLVKPPKARKIRGDKGHTMFEFCCCEDSMLGKVNQERDMDHLRITKEGNNMADDREVDSLIQLLSNFPGCDLWASIPCDPWSAWQQVNKSRLGKSFVRRLETSRRKSRKILKNFIRCAEKVLENGGHVAFEWPRGCAGWNLPELVQFLVKRNLYVAEPDGCIRTCR